MTNRNCQTISFEVMKLMQQINPQKVEECSIKLGRKNDIKTLLDKQNKRFDVMERNPGSSIDPPKSPAKTPSKMENPKSPRSEKQLPREILPMPEKTYEAIQKHIEKTTGATPKKEKKKKKDKKEKK